MPPVLHLNKEDIDTIEKRSKYEVCIVGCGNKAIHYALSFAGAGFKVKCTDADQSMTKRLSRGNIRLASREAEAKLKNFIKTENITASSELKTAISTSDIVIINVKPKIDENKCADFAEAWNMCKQIGTALSKGALAVHVGIGAFGFVETVVKESLENTSGLKTGEDFALAYVYQNEFDYEEAAQFGDEEIYVAANDKFSLNSASLVFETIAKKGVRSVSGIRLAELASLFASVKHDSNIALANEFSCFCEAAAIDYVELTKSAGNTIDLPFLPSVSNEGYRSEPYLLLDSADSLKVKLRMPLLARQINEEMVRHCVNLTQEALRFGGKPLRRARVALLSGPLESSAVHEFVTMLENKGAKVILYGPFESGSEKTDETQIVKKNLNEAIEGTNCVVIFSPQDQFKRLNLKKMHALMKSPTALVDLTGLFEPSEVEEAGFIYRGLGRGVWKK